MDFDAKAFSNILKTLCDYCGSMNKLANRTGVTASYTSYICKLIKLEYKEAPSPKILRRIADNSDGLFTYLELMYICGYFTVDEYNILKKEKNNMRNPERLDYFYNELKEIHKTYFPDWREFQLLVNMFRDTTEDPFFWETDKALQFVKEFAEKYGRTVEKNK